jgi:hypothetical protein
MQERLGLGYYHFWHTSLFFNHTRNKLNYQSPQEHPFHDRNNVRFPLMIGNHLVFIHDRTKIRFSFLIGTKMDMFQLEKNLFFAHDRNLCSIYFSSAGKKL